ncbi:CHAT domain-containing protein [Amycolatopsis vancoresmycina]|uniref:CHAT domain-containing protein n=1 Tax=Amycolatopsis vancoresmycina TaxID=208444 RepID=UPI0009DC0663|nr:CHAT domain-containing protein [Amycolatopsis vancoresmycina]
MAAARHHRTTALLGAGAAKTAVTGRLPAARVAHLATHGLISAIAPTASGIVLDGGERLSVTDLAGLDLDADLVVLSGCDTGRGEVTRGGDVVGLARQLLAAGARSAVVSLWPVDDRSTCVLMDDFHHRLAAGENAAEALQGAQQFLRSLTALDLHERYTVLCAAVGEDAPGPGSARRSPAQEDAPLRTAEWAAFVLIGRP